MVRSRVGKIVLVGTLVAGLAGLNSCATEQAGASSRTSTVVRVIDGDTLEIAGGDRVRIIGVDTPEVGTCGFDAATRAMRRLVEGQRVRLLNPTTVQDTDTYDRLLRFVEVDGTDVGLAQIEAGRGRARYDSRDGYDPHPRENRYRDADRSSRGLCVDANLPRAAPTGDLRRSPAAVRPPRRPRGGLPPESPTTVDESVTRDMPT